jgi:hypothetical protein
MSIITDYIKEGEHQRQDFKFEIDDQRKIARTLVAFANTDGGRLLIGVKDNGRISGCNPEEEFHMIEGAAELYCQPKIRFESKAHQEGHKMVLEVNITKGERRTYKAPDEEYKYKLYHRVEDETILVNKILAKVWLYEDKKVVRPDVFGEEELAILRCFGEDELTLSKIYRNSGVPMKKVDYWLPLFIYWKLVELINKPTGTVYRSKNVTIAEK